VICLTRKILSCRGLFLALEVGACATYQPGALDPKAYLARARRHARHALASTICACRAPHNVVHVDLALGVIQIEENAVVAPRADGTRLAGPAVVVSGSEG
jgi:hypothetical protein